MPDIHLPVLPSGRVGALPAAQLSYTRAHCSSGAAQQAASARHARGGGARLPLEEAAVQSMPFPKEGS